MVCHLAWSYGAQRCTTSSHPLTHTSPASTATPAPQLDLLEVLFRVARTAAPALPRRVLPSPAAEALETVTAAFDAAAAAAAGKGGAAASDLDLAAELRVVLLALNQHLGDGARCVPTSLVHGRSAPAYKIFSCVPLHKHGIVSLSYRTCHRV